MGKIIAIEGIDGSGKETQSKRLEEVLRARGFDVRRVSFPRYEDGATTLVRRYLSGEYGEDPDQVNPYTASVFYAADRADAFLKELGDFYRKGGVIITDRYTTSNMIHQASKIEDEEERERFLSWLEDLEYEKMGIPSPDQVFFLNLAPEVSMRLIEKRAEKAKSVKDIHEKDEAYLSRSASRAKRLAEGRGWTLIDCAPDGEMLPVDVIGEKLLSQVLPLLEKDHV